ncbi:hypothetical protein ScPMuIL_000988 [Solemya velum]
MENFNPSTSEYNTGNDVFSCPICLDILEKPMRVPCGYNHVYCCTCLTPYQSLAEPHCPQCRAVFDPKHIQRAVDIEKRLKTEKSRCAWCQDEMQLSKLRSHASKCRKADKTLPKFKPIKETSQPIPSHVVNRSTFMCPYCGQKNLDCGALVQHCEQNHADNSKQVVCPICASMPWGDSSLRSSNFLQHLSLRHKFEYDTYVDYDMDDDEMLRRAMQESLQQK